MECQMICKNCSGRYHGYRTCPQPVNLGTMMQLFMDFCMQQFHKFDSEDGNSERSDWMQWLKQYPGLNIKTTAMIPTTQEQTNLRKDSVSPKKSLKPGKRLRSLSRCDNSSSSEQTVKMKRRNKDYEDKKIFEKTADDYCSTSDNSTSNSSSEENEIARHCKNIYNDKATNARKVGHSRRSSKVSATDKVNKRQKEIGPEVNSTATLNMLLGHLLQNAMAGLKSST